jgi:hypothetical protein
VVVPPPMSSIEQLPGVNSRITARGTVSVVLPEVLA